MSKVLVVVGFVLLGAVGWHLFGETITNKADEFRASVQNAIEHAVEPMDKKHR